MKVAFYRHSLDARDRQACMAVLKSIFLTTGEVVKEFEDKFSQFTGAKYTVGVTSCTEALFLAAKYLGLQFGDEVITTPMSFIATANIVEYCQAKPVFVDVEPKTGNINADLIEGAITKKTKGIIVVHLYGQMCDMKEISRIAKRHKLWVIEDCAHSLEAARDGTRPGELSDAACYSFYATKNLTSGEGGAITTKNLKMADWLKRARQHGMSKNAADRYSKRYEHYDMEFLGYKANLTNIAASLMINQLDRIPKLLKIRDKLARRYERAFAEAGIDFPQILSDTTHARHLSTVWVRSQNRDQIMNDLQEKGVGVAVNFRPIHLMKYYRQKYHYRPHSYPMAEKIGNSTITLPLYPSLKKSEQDYVIDTVIKLCQS